jgi:hypothetical protein
MDYTIVAVSDQPELAPMVATWLLDEFRHPGSPTHEGLTARILAPRAGPEETFVLFEGDIPVATASLARKDLDSRPDIGSSCGGARASCHGSDPLAQHLDGRAVVRVSGWRMATAGKWC